MDNANGQNFATAFTDAMRDSQPPGQGSSPPANAPEQSSAQSASVMSPPAQQQQPAPASAGNNAPDVWGPLFERGQQFGLTGDPSKPHEFVAQLLEHAGHTNHALSYASSLLQNIPQAESTQKPVQQEPAEWTVDGHFSKSWNLPKYDPQWDRMIQSGVIQKDASGQWVPTPGNEWLAANPMLGTLNRYSADHQSLLHNMFNAGNPYKNMYEAMLEPITRLIEEKIGGNFDQRNKQQAAETALAEIERQYANVIYSGQRFNPLSGRMEQQFSEYGQKLVGAIRELESAGVGDEATRLQLAMKIMPPPAATPPTNGNGSGNGAGQANGHGNGQPNVSQAGGQGKTPFLQDALERVAHKPTGGGNSFGAQGTPGQISESELKTMFTRRWAAENAVS